MYVEQYGNPNPTGVDAIVELCVMAVAIKNHDSNDFKNVLQDQVEEMKWKDIAEFVEFTFYDGRIGCDVDRAKSNDQRMQEGLEELYEEFVRSRICEMIGHQLQSEVTSPESGGECIWCDRCGMSDSFFWGA
jgi:hypothetical protein